MNSFQEISKFKYVLFDIDDTILNYSVSNKYALEICFRYIKRLTNLDFDQIEAYYYQSKMILYDQLSETVYKHSKYLQFNLLISRIYSITQNSHLNITNLCEIYEKAFRSKMKIYKNIHQILSFLRNNDIQAFFISNNLYTVQLERLKSLGVNVSRNNLITADIVSTIKPSLKFITYLELVMGIKRDQSLIVGDSLVDDYFGFLSRGFSVKMYTKKSNLLNSKISTFQY